MSLRKILVIPLIVSLLFFVVFSVPIFGDIKLLLASQTIHTLVSMYILVILAIIVQVTAHYLRAYKMKVLSEATTNTTTKLQFSALSIGYLFNMILPLRIGELIRAQVIAYTKSVSFGFSLVLVVIERLVDLVLLACLGLVFMALGLLPQTVTPYLVSMVLFGAAVFLVVYLAWREYLPLMAAVRKMTALLNDSLKVKTRFKYWSIVYGLQRTITKGRIIKYLCLTALMWFMYAGATALILIIISNQNLNIVHIFAPFYAMSIPSGPANLGTFSHVFSEFTNTQFDVVKTLVIWAFLVLPMGLIGLYNLAFLKVPAWRKMQGETETEDLVNKLSRKSDISHGMSLFLDNYLDGNSLSRIVNRRECKDDFKLIRYFKGGSDAITILVNKKRENMVEKIIAIDLKDRLKAQYDWLTAYKDSRIIGVLGEETAYDYYSISLDYSDDNVMFFDYLHETSLDESKKVIDDIWEALSCTVHKNTKEVSSKSELKEYVDTHFYGCLDKSLKVSEDLQAVIGQEKIAINGKQLLNARTVMEKITSNKRIVKDLSSYVSSGAVHGDVIVDNILVNSRDGKGVIIDPAPDGNIINGRVFDFGKNMQSFYCGYEFLFRADEPALLGDDGSITYQDQRSLRYTQLCDYIRDELAPKYLTEAEQKAMIFHAGVLLIRRLKHQVYQDPRLTLAMYAAGVRALNDFYSLYENSEKK